MVDDLAGEINKGGPDSCDPPGLLEGLQQGPTTNKPSTTYQRDTIYKPGSLTPVCTSLDSFSPSIAFKNLPSQPSSLQLMSQTHALQTKMHRCAQKSCLYGTRQNSRTTCWKWKQLIIYAYFGVWTEWVKSSMEVYKILLNDLQEKCPVNFKQFLTSSWMAEQADAHSHQHGDVVAWWLEHRNSNPKTLGPIPWWGRVRTGFSIPPSQLLCRLVCAWPLFMCTTCTQICAHIKGSISICCKRAGPTAGGMETQKHFAHAGKQRKQPG